MFTIKEHNVIGLDIGDFTLRLVCIEKYGKKFSVVSQGELPLPQGCINDGEIQKPDQLTHAIQQLVSSSNGKKIRTDKVISVLPDTKTFIKLLKIESESIEKLPEHLIQEMPRHIPYSMDEIYFDWQMSGEFQKNAKNDVLAGAAPIQIVDSYMGVIKSAGLLPIALEIEAAPLARSLFSLHRQNNSSARIIIDFGATRTSLIVYDQNTIQFCMSLPVSGNDITRKISEKLDLDLKKAEQAKILCGLDKKKCKGILKTILMGNVSILMRKVEEAIFFYEEQNGKTGIIKEILLCGGGAYLMDLDTILYEKFHIPVKLGDPMTNISKIGNSIRLDKNNILSYATAIGLALRGSE